MKTLRTIEILFTDSEKEVELRRGWSVVAINTLYKQEDYIQTGGNTVHRVRSFSNFKKAGVKLRIVEDSSQQKTSVVFSFFKDGDKFEGSYRPLTDEYTQECEEVLFYK